MKKLSMLLAVVMLLSCCALAHAEEQTTISWTSWALAEEKLMPIYGGSADAFMAENPDIVMDYSQTNPYASVSGSAADLCRRLEMPPMWRISRPNGCLSSWSWVCSKILPPTSAKK